MTDGHDAPASRRTPKLGQLLRRLRTERLLTQEQLAEKLGTYGAQVSSWENGSRPSWSNLRRLAEVLDVSGQDLAAAILADDPRHNPPPAPLVSTAQGAGQTRLGVVGGTGEQAPTQEPAA